MADGFDDEAEPTITIGEYINSVEAEELEADLVLGGDEGKECTYVMGYMKRQAIFSCLTCTPDGNAGVCTACSLSCHDGHEIVELWTKRNFRCDCGNSKFGEFSCKLSPKKDVENVENSYNHNFKGLYCTCGRSYPDPNAEEQEEMIQCIMCEDWFHEEHLGLQSSNEIPRDEEGEPIYEDFICKACSAVCSFLSLYPKTIWAAGMPTVDPSLDHSKDKQVLEDVPSAGGSGKETNMCSGKDNFVAAANGESLPVAKATSGGESSGSKIIVDGCTENAITHTTCVLGGDSMFESPVSENKPMFLSKSWRDFLCRCQKCLDMYNVNHISYLIDEEDSIAEYEKMAKRKREEKLQKQEGSELSFLNKLGHVEKMEVLNGIADFKEEFRTFLESFDTSKSVTPSDVHKIFENLAKKRQRFR